MYVMIIYHYKHNFIHSVELIIHCFESLFSVSYIDRISRKPQTFFERFYVQLNSSDY